MTILGAQKFNKEGLRESFPRNLPHFRVHKSLGGGSMGR